MEVPVLMQKELQLINKRLKLNSMYAKIIGFQLLLIFTGCIKKENYIDTFFENMEAHSSKEIIEQFKNSSLEDVVINDFEYDEIFVKASNIVLSNKKEAYRFQDFFKNHNIPLLGRQDKWLVMAAFHKYLNKENIKLINCGKKWLSFRTKSMKKSIHLGKLN